MRAHFGDVTAEYRALRTGRGFVEGFSEVLWVEGPDCVTFLDGQVSQDVAGLTVGGAARSLVLTPRGKLVDVAWLLRGEDRIGLVVAAGNGARLIEHLEQFRFRVDADLALDARPVFEIWGSAASIEAIDVLDTGWADRDGSTTAVLPGDPLVRVLFIGADRAAMEGRAAIPCGRIALDAVRIEAGEPVVGIDLDDSTIPQESGLVGEAVSFTKGCYVGQELVARIDSRGRVNRRLVGVTIGTNVVPPSGAAVVAGAEVIGSLSSVGESLALMAPVALAMVRREAEVGDEVMVRWETGSSIGRITALPLDDLAESSQISYTDEAE